MDRFVEATSGGDPSRCRFERNPSARDFDLLFAGFAGLGNSNKRGRLLAAEVAAHVLVTVLVQPKGQAPPLSDDHFSV